MKFAGVPVTNPHEDDDCKHITPDASGNRIPRFAVNVVVFNVMPNPLLPSCRSYAPRFRLPATDTDEPLSDNSESMIVLPAPNFAKLPVAFDVEVTAFGVLPPDGQAWKLGVVLVDIRHRPVEPALTLDMAPLPPPSSTPPAVSDDAPVPPDATLSG